MYYKFFPNLLSFSRIFITPFIILFIFKNTFFYKVISFFLFFIGSLTDFLDGYIARKYNVKSSLGAYLDPLADKILILVTFYLLSYMYPGQVKLWMISIMLVRDISVTVYRNLLVNNNLTLKTSKYGKFKTLFQIIVIHLILGLHIVNPEYISLYNYIFWMTFSCVFFSVFSALNYFWINLSLYKK